MGTSQLLGLDLVLSVLTAGAWSGAAWLAVRARPGGTGSSSARLAVLALGGALLITGGRIAVLAPLAAAGWWFAGERVSVALPLLALGSAVAAGLGLPYLLRVAQRGLSRTLLGPLSVVTAAITALAAMLVPVVLGYEPHPASITVMLGLMICSVVLARVLLLPVDSSRSAKRRTTAALAVASLMSAGLAGSGAMAWLGSKAAEGTLLTAAGHHGGASTAGRARPPAPVAITTLTGATQADATVRHFELTARKERITLESGKTVDAWTFGSVPGPPLVAELGDVIEVVLKNRDVGVGVTLHWHGYDVPNAMDGVAGATQDAVLPGGSMTYRFVAAQSGTYWYHTHQASAEGVRKGLYGTLVVHDPAEVRADVDLVVAGHSLSGISLLGHSNGVQVHRAEPGSRVRLRMVNTDSVTQRYMVLGAAYSVAAVDGTELNEPPELPRDQGTILRIAAGGRIDVVLAMPATPLTLRTESSAKAAVVLVPSATSDGQAPAAADFARGTELDLFAYGGPAAAELSTTPATREGLMVLDRQLRFVDGMPRYAYTVNGAAYPQVKPLVVDEGEVVKVTIVNRTSESHPMHPHGHHVLALSRNGHAPGGSPLWLDTVDVLPGEVWEVVFRADNPGIWMDHCHNLDHAAEGMMMHLAYRGYSSPFRHGGPAGNRPE